MKKGKKEKISENNTCVSVYMFMYLYVRKWRRYLKDNLVFENNGRVEIYRIEFYLFLFFFHFRLLIN